MVGTICFQVKSVTPFRRWRECGGSDRVKRASQEGQTPREWKGIDLSKWEAIKNCSKKHVTMTLSHPKAAALASLRQALGTNVRSGSEWLRECESRETPLLRSPAGEIGIDVLLEGLRPGRITEVIVAGPSRGGGLIFAALLARARCEGRYMALVDVGSGLVIENIPERDLESLLWIGCDSVEQAVAACDVVARDENFRWLLVDGREARSEDWRTVPPSVWQRIVRSLREQGVIGLILARVPVTGVVKDRYEVQTHLDAEAFHEERSRLLKRMRVRSVRGEVR